MAVDDLWYSAKRGPDGERVPTRRHGRGKRWRVRFTDDAGRPVQRLFERKAEADRFDASARTDVSRGQYVDAAAGRVTVEQYAGQWIARQVWRQGTVERTERQLRRHVFPVLGRHAMAAVRPSHIQAWVKGAELAPSTVRIAFAVLVSMFGAAVLDRVIGTSPCVGVNLPELPHSDHVILTPAQVHTLASALPARYRAMAYVGAGCGLRLGEALGLELGHVDFLRREIHVRQQLNSLAQASRSSRYLKTRTSTRTVELPAVVAAELARHIEHHPPAPVDVIDRTDPRRETTRPSALLFTNTAGRPQHRGSWAKTWGSARDAAGLPAGVGFHALRHYFATLLIFSGANVKTVQLALGHSSPTITLDAYVGLWPDSADRTRTIVDAALGTAPEAVASS